MDSSEQKSTHDKGLEDLARAVAIEAASGSDEYKTYFPIHIESLIREYTRGRQQFGDFGSLHEGYAVLLEEVDEVWELIKRKVLSPSQELAILSDIEKEARQVAAMGLKLSIFAASKFVDLAERKEAGL